MSAARDGGFFAPEFSLEGRSAIVTGSSRGIGRAVALELARRGCDALVNCRSSRTAADAVAAEIRALNRRAVVLQADIVDRASHPRIVDAACEAFGGIDILVNNAATPRVVDVLEEDEASFEAVLHTNLEDLGKLGFGHHGIGSNYAIGGQVKAPCHIDVIYAAASLEIDGRAVLKDGRLLV